MNHDSYSDSLIRDILKSVKRIALVGASSNEARPSWIVTKYLLDRGYDVIPVNPGLAGQTLLGKTVYGSLKDIPGAIEAYRQILTIDINQKWTAMLEPRYVLELARLLDKQGDKAGARKEYQRFLELWNHADPGLPEVSEARSRIGS